MLKYKYKYHVIIHENKLKASTPQLAPLFAIGVEIKYHIDGFLSIECLLHCEVKLLEQPLQRQLIEGIVINRHDIETVETLVYFYFRRSKLVGRSLFAFLLLRQIYMIRLINLDGSLWVIHWRLLTLILA